jgi:tetratricopeptide (TPR) repeat protein
MFTASPVLLMTLSAVLAAANDQAKPAQKPAGVMPFQMAPAKIAPNFCVVHYRITTQSPDCQAFFDQGLGWFYSYTWMEAARSFDTATRSDPECAMAWWGLSRALEGWSKGDHVKALLRAWDLRDHVSEREQLLIKARMQEKGLLPGVGNSEKRKKAAIETIDNLLAQYDDDEEGWYYRAQLGGGAGGFGGSLGGVPFYKALVHVNRLHPGANHELLHFYEKYQRPALGWIYAENYILSSPGLPHAFHMQAHLATRLGRWDKTGDRSAHAIELHRAYQKLMNVKPADDYQFPHHLEILTVSLIHDGRYKEAHAIKHEVLGYGMRLDLPWFRLAMAEGDLTAALSLAERFRKNEKNTASYLAALVYLKKGEPARAAPEVEALRTAHESNKKDRTLADRAEEVQGLLLCALGSTEPGLKTLAQLAERSKKDYGHHAWGNGAYLLETWGLAALEAGKLDLAEEAFLEALAHDPAALRAALGMQVICERQARSEEAARYRELAQKCSRRADPQVCTRELAMLRGEKTEPKRGRP